MILDRYLHTATEALRAAKIAGYAESAGQRLKSLNHYAAATELGCVPGGGVGAVGNWLAAATAKALAQAGQLPTAMVVADTFSVRFWSPQLNPNQDQTLLSRYGNWSRAMRIEEPGRVTQPRPAERTPTTQRR